MKSNRMNGHAGGPARRRMRAGVAELRLMVLVLVLGLLGTTAAGLRWVFRGMQQERMCIEHLQQIYSAFELYQAEHGALPRLVLYPEEKYANGSLLRFLRDVGYPEEIAICPACGRRIRKYGVSYIWNTELNNQRLGKTGLPWMLVEINALDPTNYPAPHRGKYHVLYTDGTVRRTEHPPPGLTPDSGDGSQ